MSYLYKIMTYDKDDIGWEDDSFATGWDPVWYGSMSRDGDIITVTPNAGYSIAYVEKSELSINASTYKYCVFCVRGVKQYFVEVYDGTWRNITGGSPNAPSDYDVIIIDLTPFTTGTITAVRLGTDGGEFQSAQYDFIAFSIYQPQLETDNILSIIARQRETDIDEFEIVGTSVIESGVTVGRRIRIWLNGVDIARKIFAGVIEESTPRDGYGGVLYVSGRCLGQKLLLRTKSKTFNNREVSLAVKDLVEDLSEVTTYQVDTPSPTVNITRDFKYEYIMDGLKDLAKQAGSDWEVKLGMGQDLRFKSRTNDLSCPISISEAAGHILRGVVKESDGFRTFNKVTVIGGELSNFDNDPDAYTDTGDATNWEAAGGGSVTEDKDNIAFGECSLRFSWTNYLNELICRYDLGASGKDLTPFKYSKFHHKTDSTGIERDPGNADFRFLARLKDTSGYAATITYLPWGPTQPPQNFTEVILKLSDFSVPGGFDWEHIRYIELECDSDQTQAGNGVKGNYWIDRLHFNTGNVTVSKSGTSDFRHTREYVYRDDKLIDPDFVSEVADALLNILKNKENRYRIPLVGIPSVQVGYKANVVSPTWDLNGYFHVVEAEHKVTPSEGYITEMVLERPRLYLEKLLAEAIERKIKIIERGGIQ